MVPGVAGFESRQPTSSAVPLTLFCLHLFTRFSSRHQQLLGEIWVVSTCVVRKQSQTGWPVGSCMSRATNVTVAAIFMFVLWQSWPWDMSVCDSRTWPIGWHTYSGLPRSVLECTQPWAHWLVCHPTSRTLIGRLESGCPEPLQPEGLQQKFSFKSVSVRLDILHDTSVSLPPS